MRTVDVFYAFPSVLLAIALSGALGAGIGNALLSLTLVFVPQVARIAESVTAGAAYGLYRRRPGHWRQRVDHYPRPVLGNVLGPIFVFSTGLISVCMILASGLSFLGLGVRPPEPEWGLMLNTLRTAIYTQPWVAALPGLMILSPPFRSISSRTACVRQWRLRSKRCNPLSISTLAGRRSPAEGQSPAEVLSRRQRPGGGAGGGRYQLHGDERRNHGGGRRVGLRQIDHRPAADAVAHRDSGELIFDGQGSARRVCR